MSHAGVSRTLVVLVAAASLASCSTYKRRNDALVELAPAAGSIHVNFSCTGVPSLALEDSVGHTAWVVRRNPDDLIRWVVPPTVTINSITGPSFPVDTAAVPGTRGGAPGVSYNAKVSPSAPDGRYHYAIDVTCHSTPTDSSRLLIDPEFIVPR